VGLRARDGATAIEFPVDHSEGDDICRPHLDSRNEQAASLGVLGGDEIVDQQAKGKQVRSDDQRGQRQ